MSGSEDREETWFRVYYSTPKKFMDVKAKDSVQAADEVVWLGVRGRDT